ncbi:MAG TPA: glycosyltransferase family 4 protein [Methylomirabilota bacterium]|nr:glycosyltransferase family 4 protein [Methylomirabilota bacterium]
MKILWVSPFLPRSDAPHAGGRALAQWVRWTAERHDVTLLCRIEPAERPAAEAWRTRLAGLHLQEFRRPRGPATAARIAASYARLGREANRLLGAGVFDLLHAEYLETGLAIDGALPVPKLAVAIDELARPARHRLALARGPGARLGAWLYWRGVDRLQRRICRKFDRVLALSEHDRRTLAAIDPGLSVGVLPFPTGVDPVATAAVSRDDAGLLFVGAMHRDANVDAVRHFCADILPRIKAEVPATTLTIAGGDPTTVVNRLATMPGVRVTGFVEALEPFYGGATVFVAPLRIAGGIAGKTLDALASGCPVVTTTIGNEGLDATPGVHLLVADAPGDFAASVVRLLRDPALRRRLGEAGRRFAGERHGPAVSAAALEREHQALVRGPALTRRSGA